MNKGIKHDEQKLRWDLLPFRSLQEVVKVLTYGALKYSDDNWQIVEDAKRRYFAALMRHLTDWWLGEKYDRETKINHLAHACCCLFFLLWFDLEDEKKNDNG